VRLQGGRNFTASVFQWIQLTPGATYELSADLFTDGQSRATLGVKWENNGDGPSQSLTNGSSNHTVRVRFTVPEGMAKVGIYCLARGSLFSNSWVSADNFKLVQVD
jgi:hypothetical protein